MPWNESNRMEERLRFVARILEGEKMSVACREFGISRKTGYKIYSRYREAGIEGLKDRARRPYRYPNGKPLQIKKSILRLKKEHSSCGAPTIKETLKKEVPILTPTQFNASRSKRGCRA